MEPNESTLCKYPKYEVPRDVPFTSACVHVMKAYESTKFCIVHTYLSMHSYVNTPSIYSTLSIQECHPLNGIIFKEDSL